MFLLKERYKKILIKKLNAIMYYYCPKCSSKKKPKLINYFPPITAKCLDCGYINIEKNFINNEERPSNKLLNYSH